MQLSRIPPVRRPGAWLAMLCILLAGHQAVFSRPVPGTWPPEPMKRANTNLPAWHSLQRLPGPHLPQIPFYDKLNPVWWAENADEPAPPDWYLPGDGHRDRKWLFRNPFHNFDFYVIGVADKKFIRGGRYPARNSNPHGGWDFEVIRRRLALLPFVSYERPRITFYFGWRESGAFGIELRWRRKGTRKA